MNTKGEYNIKEAIAEFLDVYRLREGYNRIRINEIWKETAGDFIARLTYKIELKNTILMIYVTSPIVKKELTMRKTEIIKLLQEKTGKHLITKLEIR
jgi:predicted nucleic acid-binding Zn ribbon protein